MKVAVVMGSDSDWPIMKLAIETLEDFGVKTHREVVSAHRTPQKMLDFAKNAHANKIDIIIAGAGGAAHLPGMLASNCSIPVIGVPVKLKSLDGIDSLLSIVQMPKGVPVATVAIDNAQNAALLAIRILAIHNPSLLKKMDEFRENMALESEQKTSKIGLV
jgi:5-(carboxyamino)imidazole ribonucleotide mutase